MKISGILSETMSANDMSEQSTSSSDIQCQLSHLHRADGSCAMAVRDTFVWAAVYGPADLSMSKQKTGQLCCFHKITNSLLPTLVFKVCK